MSVPKNFGFKTIPVETQARQMDHKPFNVHVYFKQAQKDWEEIAKELKDYDSRG